MLTVKLQLERFSNGCRKPRIKLLTATNHNRSKKELRTHQFLLLTYNRIIARTQGAIGLGFASDWSKNGRAIFKPITSERCPRNSTLSASKKIVSVATYLVVPQGSLCSRCRLLRAHERPAETKRNVAMGHLVKNKEYLLLLPPGKVEGNESRKRPH